MAISKFEDFKDYLNVNIASAPNTYVRNSAFPLDRWSVFPSYDAATKYIQEEKSIAEMGGADARAKAYDGQIIAIAENEFSEWTCVTATPSFTIEGTTVKFSNGVTKLATASTEEADQAGGESLKLTLTVKAGDLAVPAVPGTGDDVELTFTRTYGQTQNVYVVDHNAPDGLKKIGGGAGSGAASGDVEAETARAMAKENALSDAIKLSVDNMLSSLDIELSSTVEGLDANILRKYTLTQGGQLVGEINIPKDFLVKGATTATATAEDVAEGGKLFGQDIEAGEKYIDFTVNTKSDDPANPDNESHVYLKVKDLTDGLTTDLTTMSSHIALSVDQISSIVSDLRTDVDTMSSHIALSVDQISTATAVSVDNLHTDVTTISNHVAVSVDTLRTDVDTMSSHIALSVDQLSNAISSIGENYLTKETFNAISTTIGLDAAAADNKVLTLSDLNSIKLSVDEISAAVALSAAGMSAATALSVAEMSSAVALSVDTLRTDVDTMSAHVALSVDTMSAHTAVSVDTLRTDVDTMSAHTALSVAEMSAAVALSVDQLCLAISSVGENYLTKETFNAISTTIGLDAATADNKVLTLSDLNGIKLSVDTMSSHIAVSVDNLETKTNDMSTAVALSVDEMSAAVALSVDEISNVVKLSVEQLVQEMNDGLSDLELSVATMSAHIALSVDTMSAHTAVSVDNLRTDVDTMSSHIALSVDEISTAVALSAAAISATADNKFLTKETFDAISCVTGLSAANAENPVVTKKDIASLAGAMHFRDAVTPTVTSEMTLEQVKEAEVEAIEQTIEDPKAGDVVIITTSSREYVYAGPEDDLKWYELGDEGIYMTKADFELWRDETFEPWQESVDISVDNIAIDLATMSSHIALSVDTISAHVALSVDEISAAVALSVDEISTAVALSVDEISTAVHNKVKVGDFGKELSAVDELSVVHIDADTYHQMVKDETVDPTTIYVVSSDTVNCYGERITNVAPAEDLSDAVNFEQFCDGMDSLADELSTDYTQKIQDLHDNSISSVRINGVDAEIEDNVAVFRFAYIFGGNAEDGAYDVSVAQEPSSGDPAKPADDPATV